MAGKIESKLAEMGVTLPIAASPKVAKILNLENRGRFVVRFRPGAPHRQ